ncbi:YeeE/YedE family protein [Brevundimonas sp.]|uniref:YeeE/YedE family protein n=1 Tax=Brevundimonas sp. TaxID=1871086 RepID=UPI003D0F8526
MGDLLANAMPVRGLIGGLMIGTASAVMLLGLGRIAGVSGLVARAAGISASGAPRGLSIAFVMGLPLGALLVTLALGPVEARFPAGVSSLIIAGLLVGFGTRLGSGCTSGHGVYGLSRFSARSMVATATFMGAGFATVAIMNALGLGR